MFFPDTVNLPFNGEIIKARFSQIRPGQLVTNDEGYWAILQKDALVMCNGALLHGELPAVLAASARDLQLFGSWDGKPVRVCSLPGELALPDGFYAVPWTELPDDLATLYGMARQITYWERMSANCSRCGSSMERIAYSWGKKCDGCGHEHYPHIHPCIIVLIKRGDEFLLVRKPEWAPGRYSLVAGFVDFGESLEECVEREAQEETGVKVTNVRYVGSQNWPFPSQLMAGFVADYVSGEIEVEVNELADARWFSAKEMPTALPPTRSIARWIIDRYALGLYPVDPPAAAAGAGSEKRPLEEKNAKVM
ncbi:NAD(+) diphosphatase [Geomonas sp.]|uniref:NAD(+) diphosphatase n=1 Tax=Geomonas sp. TaxID=2651584 RepID=UPI002B4909FD|nr:NAD(+) diphosphatase [Geomonas sp.]HJV34611.1 NAD(+) diphosphatase [Geomonas sp.]